MALLTADRPVAQVEGRRGWTRVELGAMAVSSLLGLLVFFFRLTTPSVINDEIIYRASAAQYVRGVFELNNEHPPLAKLLIGTSQQLFGGSVFADRFPGALLGFLTGLVVAATAWQVTRTPRAAIAAGALWWLLPIAPGIVHVHVARAAVLEGPMLFLIAAATLTATVALQRRGLPWWVLSGALAGLAASSKLTGAVAVVTLIPAAVALRRTPGRLLVHAVSAAGAFVVAFLLPYAPMGAQAPEVLQQAFTFQLQRAADGHLQTVAGTVYLFQPWWAPFWFQAQYLGWAALAALFVASVVGVVRTRRSGSSPAAVVLVAGVLLVCSSPIKLPQYQDLWAPAMCVLAGVALAPRLRGVVAAVVVVAFGVLAVAGATQLRSVAGESVQDYRAAGAFLEARVSDGEPITVWGDSGALALVVRGHPLPEPLPPDGRPVALVVDPTIADRRPDEDVAGWLARHGAAYDAFRFDRLTVYLRR